MAGDIYRRPREDVHPPRDFPGSRGTALRHPRQPLVLIPQTLSEITGPVYGHSSVTEADRDLTNRSAGEPIGERIIVEGRVIDEDGRPVRESLVELWQANAAGRYPHHVDRLTRPVGPFFAMRLGESGWADGGAEKAIGGHSTVEGPVREGDGAVVPDSLVEIWQANAAGRYAHPDDHQSKPLDPNFTGYGRAPTDDNGHFAIETVMPGRVPGPDGTLQAPHLLLGILARGILTRLVTRIYFDDEPSTQEDPILALVPADRRTTLIAKHTDDDRYQFDLILQ